MSITGKYLRRWLPNHLRQVVSRALSRPVVGKRHLLVAICDHHEPRWGGADIATALARVAYWRDRYPRFAESFRDDDGRPPQHSFFFPGEEYAPELLGGIDELVRAGFGEVELHLHHDNDVVASLRTKILSYLSLFAEHGHFSRTEDGSVRYAFIHGNWALANSRPDGRQCGVDAELPLLFETGCYADFTFPSGPDPTQSGMINAIYWPVGDLARRCAHERGEVARVGKSYSDRPLLFTGPLAISTKSGHSFRPRLEYSALTSHDPGTTRRAAVWVRQGIAVRGRPEWVFVKLHTHGSPEREAQSLLGDGGRQLHEALAEVAQAGHFDLHYVTAREMYNVACAAMAGQAGNPNDFRDYSLSPPPIREKSDSQAE